MNYNWLDNFKGVKVDFTPNFSNYGYWAFLDNDGMLVIGEERGYYGGQLYRGPWKGEDTPYLSDIKKEQPKLFSKIMNFYEKEFGNLTLEKKKTTKTLYVSYSVLKVVEVPDDWNDREIKDYLEGIAPESYNDMEYDVEED